MVPPSERRNYKAADLFDRARDYIDSTNHTAKVKEMHHSALDATLATGVIKNVTSTFSKKELLATRDRVCRIIQARNPVIRDILAPFVLEATKHFNELGCWVKG